MPDEVPDSALQLLFVASGLSFITLFYLFQKHVSGSPLLPYEPRRRVPWGSTVGILAIAFPMLGVAAYLLDSETPATKLDQSDEILLNGWSNFAFMMMFVLGVAAWLVSFFRADVHDLGLPTSWRQLRGDVLIGIVATVAAFLPVYFIQLLLLVALKSETTHPLVEQMSEHQSPGMLALGFAMAVIAAPIFEEFTFRGLLQGWLERCEDQALAFSATEREPQVIVANLGDEDEQDMVVAPTYAPPLVDPEIPALPRPQRPARGWIPDLPHGWTPILISGTIFGLAHLGHGVAPVALILFGVVLGYLYQRTHRLAPCIAAHMLFNGYSMLQLWLQLDATKN